MMSNNNKKIKYISLFILLLFLLIKPITISAQDNITNYSLKDSFGENSVLDQTAKESGFRILDNKEFQFYYIISTVIYLIFSVLGVIFVVLTILSGYQWMTASGNQEQVAKAKKSLKQNITGLLIIIISWGAWTLILRVINQF